MEKYTKFDDPSNGLNPFTPLELPKDSRHWVTKLFRRFLGWFFILLRLPLFMIVLWVAMIMNTVKYFLVHPWLIRKFEKFIDGLMGQMVMISSSINNVNLMYHREHKDYDFVKIQKGEMKFQMKEGDVYICN